MNLLTFAGAWASIVGGIIALFTLAENVAASHTKAGIARWLRSEQSNLPVDTWPNHFVSLFDSIFGESHFRPKCIIASIVASVFGALCIGLLFISIFPDIWLEVHEVFGDSKLEVGVTLVITVLIFNAIPDYISLLESRYLLGILARNLTWLKVSVVLIVDVFITAFIWVALCLVFSSFLDWFFFESESWLDSIGAMWELMEAAITEDGFARFIVGVTFLSTFFTSAWLWVYLGAGVLIRLVNMLSRGRMKIAGLLDTNKTPILSIGFISCLLVSIVFLISAPYAIELSINKEMQPTTVSGD